MNKLEEFTAKTLSPFESLIGAENVKDVQKRIADLIVLQVEKDIADYDYYMFYPQDCSDIIQEAFDSTQKKINKMYKDAMLEIAEKAVEKFKNDALEFMDNMSVKRD